MTFGERMRRAREAKRLTQEDVSRYLDISYSTISKWENGKSAPTQKTLLQIAQLYDVDPGYLLTGESIQEDSMELRIARLFQGLDTDSKRMVLDLVQKLSTKEQQPSSSEVAEEEAEYVINKYAIRNDDELMSKEEVLAYIKVKELLSKDNDSGNGEPSKD